MTLIDTNVIIDIVDRDPTWFDWSASHLAEAASDGAWANAITVAELSRDYDSYAQVHGELHELGIVLVPLDEESAFLGGKRYQGYRLMRPSGENARVLPDFLIGAHALTMGVALMTRDPRLYRRYFPDLPLITPETHP